MNEKEQIAELKASERRLIEICAGLRVELKLARGGLQHLLGVFRDVLAEAGPKVKKMPASKGKEALQQHLDSYVQLAEWTENRLAAGSATQVKKDLPASTVCVSCGKVPVDTDAGEDTCPDCLAAQ